MRNPAGVRRDFEALGVRRFKADALQAAPERGGSRPASWCSSAGESVAVAAGGGRPRELEEGGPRRAQAKAHRRPALARRAGPQARCRDTRLPHESPDRVGIGVLIEETCGVMYNSGHVWRLCSSSSAGERAADGSRAEAGRAATRRWKHYAILNKSSLGPRRANEVGADPHRR